MPKLRKLPPTEAERQQAVISETAKIIEKAMIDANVRFYKDVAPLVGLSAATFSNKMRTGAWTQKDLCKLIRAFALDEQAALKLVGVGV